jgi:hypothetical protein
MPGYAKPPTYNGDNITISPVGSISSTTLQSTISELQTDTAATYATIAEVAASEAGLNTFLLIGA